MDKKKYWLNKRIYKTLFMNNLKILFDLITNLIDKLISTENYENRLLLSKLSKELKINQIDFKLNYNELRENIEKEVNFEHSNSLY